MVKRKCSVGESERTKDDESDFEALKKRLIEDNTYFTMLADSIPENFYSNKKIKGKNSDENNSHMRESSDEIKKISSDRMKNKHKNAFLNRSLEDEFDKNCETRTKVQKKGKNKSASLARAALIEELQKRIQSKISESKTKRKAPTGAEKLEARRLRKKMKRGKHAKSKTKQGNIAKPIIKSENDNTTLNSDKIAGKKRPPKKVFNKDSTMIYSKFEFTEDGDKPSLKSIAKKNKDLLAKVEKQQEKIETLKQTDADKARELLTKAAWKRAIQKSEGDKLADDPALIKKTIKQIEKKKKKSASEWNERLANVEKKKKLKQEKRTKNIKTRKKEKLDKKIKRAKKKGRIIPGF